MVLETASIYLDVGESNRKFSRKFTRKNNGFYIKMLRKNVDMAMLNLMFGKSLASYCLTRVSPNEICIVKKNAKMNRFIIVLVGIELLILAITVVMLLRKK